MNIIDLVNKYELLVNAQEVTNDGPTEISFALGAKKQAPGFDSGAKSTVFNTLSEKGVRGSVQNKVKVFKGSKGQPKKVQILTSVNGKFDPNASALLNKSFVNSFGQALKDLNLLEDFTIDWLNFSISEE